MPVTFEVQSGLKPEPSPGPATIAQHLYSNMQNNKGMMVKTSNRNENKYVKTRFHHGLVGACITAYNHHYPLLLSPDHIWVSITSAFSRYVNKNPNLFREKLVDHDGKVTLQSFALGSDIINADYDELISQLSDQIDLKTKGDLRQWIECDFSTTSPLDKIVSKIVLMSTVKQYFNYEMYLMCGLPQVTLLGTEDDWKSILQKIQKLKEFGDSNLTKWAKVLQFVLNKFVSAFSNNIDKDFWNRVAHYTGAGSGVRYLEGWILAFIAFDKEGIYFLNNMKDIKLSHKFGRMDTNKVPSGTIEVPVYINDNGREYNTIFYAGPMQAAMTEDGTIFPSLDWALVVTEARDGENTIPIKVPFENYGITQEYEDSYEMNTRHKPSKPSKCVMS